MKIKLDCLPTLGVGVAYRRHYMKQLAKHINYFNFIEIVADNFFDFSSDQLIELKNLREILPVTLQSLNISIGSDGGVSIDYLKKLQRLIAYVKPTWLTDHLCFTRSRDISVGYFLPLPRTKETLDVLHYNMTQLQEHIKIPCFFRNISYLFEYSFNELSEFEFLKAIVRDTHVGLSIDVTNIYANCINYDRDPIEFILNLPMSHIVNIHFSGGGWDASKYINSGTNSTPEDIWHLMEIIVKYASIKGMILHRSDNVPLSALVGELERARELGRKYGRWH